MDGLQFQKGGDPLRVISTDNLSGFVKEKKISLEGLATIWIFLVGSVVLLKEELWGNSSEVVLDWMFL